MSVWKTDDVNSGKTLFPMIIYFIKTPVCGGDDDERGLTFEIMEMNICFPKLIL